MIRFGTRGSGLALWQTSHVIDALRSPFPEIDAVPVVIQTQGDLDRTSPLSVIGGRGVFTSALEDALRRNEIDAAVHSAKDLPTEVAPDLTIAAFLSRDDPRDVVISRHGCGLADLPASPVIGTSSRRRSAQVLRLRPDAKIVELRGNIDTRLAKAARDELDAIILAAAGVSRMGWRDRITEYLPVDEFVPSPGQGALAIEIRAGDLATADFIATLDDPAVSVAVNAERSFLRTLGAGCSMPVGAHARLDDDHIDLTAMVASEDGGRLRIERRSFGIDRAELAAADLALQMIDSLRPTKPRKTVLVTRAAGEDGKLDAALSAVGLDSVAAPSILIEPIPEDEQLASIVDQLLAGRFDWMVFTSRHAVHWLTGALARRNVKPTSLHGVQIAAVGESTSHRLERAGFAPQFGGTSSSAATLADALVSEGMSGRKVLFLKGDLALPTIESVLTDAGAEVTSVDVYRTTPGSGLSNESARKLKAGEIDALTFFSPSSVAGFAASLKDRGLNLPDVPTVCLGPTTAAAAIARGFHRVTVAQQPTISALVEAVIDAIEHVQREDQR